MKKFFELSVTSRKSVKGDLFLTAEMLSKEDVKLGQLDIKLLNNDCHGGVFIKYNPAEACNPTDVISKVRFSGRDKDEIRETLEAIPEAIRSSLNSPNANSNTLATFLMLSMCINAKDNSITIPDAFGIAITGEIISNILGDDWLGVEFKLSSNITAKISDVATAKRKMLHPDPEPDIEDLLAAFNNCIK